MTMTEEHDLEAAPGDETPTPTGAQPAEETTTDETDVRAGTPEPDEGDTTDDGPGREAAKYRRRLRDTEAERDALAATVDTLRRQIIEAALDRSPITAEAFWAGGTDVADLLDNTGAVDVDRVAEVAAEVAARFGVKRQAMDLGQGARGSGHAAGKGWADVLGPH